MVGDEFLNEIFKLFVASVETAAFLSCEHYVFNSFNFGGRTGHSYLFGISLYESGAPLRDVEIGASCDKGFTGIVELGLLGGGSCIFVLLDSLGIAGAAFGSGAVNRHNTGKRCFYGFNTVFKTTFHNDVSVFEFKDFLCVCNLGKSELFSNLGAYLCGITVDGLTASENDIVIAHFLYGLGKGVGGGECIGSAKNSVGENYAAVGAAKHSLADNFRGAGKTHGENRNGRAGVGILQTECLLKSVEVFRIKDGGEGGAVSGTCFARTIMLRLIEIIVNYVR